jgi:hypothetical protein
MLWQLHTQERIQRRKNLERPQGGQFRWGNWREMVVTVLGMCVPLWPIRRLGNTVGLNGSGFATLAEKLRPPRYLCR